MNAAAFCEYVNNHLLLSSHLPPFSPRSVSLRTAIRWLHHLGFKPRSHKKGVYIDGQDVVKHRKVFLKVMAELNHLPSVMTKSRVFEWRKTTKKKEAGGSLP